MTIDTNAIVTAVFVMMIAGPMIYATTIVPPMGKMGRYNR